MRFDSGFMCEFERNTSKDNRSFVTLSLSSTVHAEARDFSESKKPNCVKGKTVQPKVNEIFPSFENLLRGENIFRSC